MRWVVVVVAVVACSSPRATQDVADARMSDAAGDAYVADAAADGVVVSPADAPPDAPPDATLATPPDAPPPLPPQIVAIAPALGSVKGGATVTIDGAHFEPAATVAIGGIACAPVLFDSSAQIRCVTGDSQFVEGARDVVVTNPDGSVATLSGAFTYECPWTTSTGRRSCGAVPPRPSFAAQPIAVWLTQLEPNHGFVANPGGVGDNLDDTTDATLGSQSAVIVTDGGGTLRTLTRLGAPAVDFTNRMPKLWVKIEQVRRAATLQLDLGDSQLANVFRFNFKSTQGQLWATEGDWVAFTLPWSAATTIIGNPDRTAITDLRLRIIDDATGVPVRFHLNGIAAVDEPIQTYPRGVVSFTFDDNFASMVTEGLPPLVAHGFPATAYVIVDMVGRTGRATLTQLATLQATHGWEVAAHAFTDLHHAARFTNLAPATLEDDLVDVRAWLIANRFEGYDHCAYPGGDFTGGIGTNVLGIAATYFATCRTIFQGMRETYLPAHSHKLRVFYITNAVTLASAIAAVDRAVTNREWIILVFHKLVDAPVVTTEWAITDYQALVTHVASTNAAVKTVGKVLAP
ncbi:MAG: IPT/TIG domain-containing protein [Myxococcota bacterium]|nr:IPT/TIG domain-containing protein [Myxococcota bacterium]